MKLRSELSAGHEVRWAEIDGLRVGEVRMAAATRLAAHRHAWGQLCFVLDGAYEEVWDGRPQPLVAGDLFYRPPGFPHANRFDEEVTTLLVSAAPRRLAALAGTGPRRLPPWIVGPLHREIEPLLGEARGDLPLLEDLSSLLLSRIERTAPAPAPAWLLAAEAVVRRRLDRPLGLSAVARTVGVHRATLAAGTRRHRGCTFGELVRRARVRHAADLLRHGDRPLADVALECGFADQPHLTRTFRVLIGTTPARFRATGNVLTWASPNKCKRLEDGH